MYLSRLRLLFEFYHLVYFCVVFLRLQIIN